VAYLDEFNISKSCKCTFCNGVETLSHLFVFCENVVPLWKFITRTICAYSGIKVKLEAACIIFNVFKKSGQSELDDLLLYFVALGKFCIWTARNITKFEKNHILAKGILNMFISKLRLRILTDFHRFERKRFCDIWLRNDFLCEIKQNNVQVNLKPP